ncbi:hypothetical protein [Marinomonas primoryensis]|uniref:Uncharacterized protein n=1 Tax=Marinomonas primoryensis TaxID=178399 RepID=A0ABV0L7I3_9GAMM
MLNKINNKYSHKIKFIKTLPIALMISSSCYADVFQQLNGGNVIGVTQETLDLTTNIALLQEFNNMTTVSIKTAGENSTDARLKNAFLGTDNNKWRLIITQTWHQPNNDGQHFTAQLRKREYVGAVYEYITTFHQYAKLNKAKTLFVCTHGTNPNQITKC